MPRYRYEDSRGPSRYVVIDYNYDGSTGVRNISSASLATGKFRSITDTVTPNYFSKRKSGAVVLNGVSLNKITKNSSDSHWTIGPHAGWGTRTVDGSVACELHGNIQIDVSTHNSDMSSLTDQSLIDAYASMNESDLMLGVTLAERHKTWSMMRRPMNGALAHLKKMVTRRLSLVKKGLTMAEASASAWLEYRYGWKPLMFDIEGTFKVIGDSRPPSDQLIVKRKSYSKTSKGSNDGSYTSVVGVDTVDVEHSWELTSKVSSGVIFTIDDGSDAAFAARRLGANLSARPSDFWELVPWSFVLDWFIDVGSFIQAVTPQPAIHVKGNWTTRKDSLTTNTRVLSAKKSVATVEQPAKTYINTGGHFGEEILSTTRSVNLSLPALPPVKPLGLSPVHSIDAIALMTSRAVKLLQSFKH